MNSNSTTEGKCKCGKDANIYLPHRRKHYCTEHFLSYVRNTVLNTIRDYKLIQENDRVLLAVSGGKDSLVLLHILNWAKDKLNFELIPLTINLGINKNNYSNDSVKVTLENCEKLGLKLKIIDLKKEYGFSLDEMALYTKKSVCAACGTIKRYLINKEAIKAEVDCVATGHNLTDGVVFLLNNLIKGDLLLLSRYKIKLPKKDKLVPRIKPLFFIYEKETSFYSYLAGIKTVESSCAYGGSAPTFKMKQIALKMEEVEPGSNLQLMRSFIRRLLPILPEEDLSPLQNCVICGLPSSKKVCAFCKLRRNVFEKKRSLLL
ncbi:MAG: ATP-binding protein [Candidatus Odinarchaeia archaeon]